MIIKYIKEKPTRGGGLIPVGRMVDCTKEFGQSEIDSGFAVIGDSTKFEAVQKERFVKAISEQEEIVTKKHKK